MPINNGSKRDYNISEFDFRHHLTHFCDLDPNAIIYEEILKRHGTLRAKRFLEYRRSFEVAKQRREISSYPITVTIGLKDACNLKCPHCYRQHNPDRASRRSLKWETVTRVLDECADLGVPAVLFGTESEMFMHERAMDAVEYAISKGIIDVWVATNGQLLTKQRIDRLIDLGVTRLTVSIDAATPETYARVRGGDYLRVTEAIEYFLESRARSGSLLPVLRVTFVAFNLNRNEKDDFVKLWRGKADLVDIQSMMDIKNINTLKYTEIDNLDCAYPYTMLYVRWDGTCFPCCSEFCKYLPIGNVERNSLSEIWAGISMNNLRRSLENPSGYPRACINCVRSLGSEEAYDGIE